MCSTLKDKVNEELLAFIGQGKVAAASIVINYFEMEHVY